MILHPLHIGCDISKSAIDIFDPRRGARRIANTAQDCSAFATGLCGTSALVVMEATGPYDGALCEALAQAGVPYARVNPTRARRFAQAAGLTAKTDAVDARMLSRLGQALRPDPQGPVDETRKALNQLHKRRDQLVQIRADEKKRAHHATGGALASIRHHIDWLSAEIEQIEASITELLGSAELKPQAEILRSAPGIGSVAATTLLALMPELGHLSSKQIASLAGLAPIARDSGAFRGLRRIGQGRSRVRKALYMAALTARRTSPRSPPSTSASSQQEKPQSSQSSPSQESSSLHSTL